MAQIKTLADIEAFEADPLEARNLPDSTYEVLKNIAEKQPDDPALIFFLQGTAYQDSITFSFRDLLGKMTQTANMLHDLGVGPTDTVSYILPNLPQTYFTLYGGEAAGIANPINPLLEPHTIAEIMIAAETKVLVTLAPFPRTDVWEKVASVVDQVPTLHTILQIDIANYLSGAKKLVVNLMRLAKSKGHPRLKVLDFDKTLANYPSDRLVSGRIIKREDIASYFHTGGTTGTPKIAVHTHYNEVFDGWAVGETVDGGPGKMYYLGLPLFHNYGAIAIGIGAWVVGGGVVMGTPQGFRGEGVLENLWDILAYYRCTLLSGVPTLFSALLNIPTGDNDLSALEVATCGAAPLPVEVANQFTKKTGVNILEGYGLTEATSVCSVNPMFGEPRIGSIGFRLPYQEMATVIMSGSDFERFCEPEEVGLVAMRGPNVFPGYREEIHNEGVFFDTGDGQGPWLNTGDLGHMDEDGYFWLTGRKKELIIRGGHNIDPKQIEEPMHTHPAVALAAAIGRPDAHAGELPVVYVELKPDQTATEAELMEFAQKNIGERAAVPKQIFITDVLPQTAVGKIFKPELVREQVKDVFDKELARIEGVESATVVPEGDKRLGTIAHVKVTAAAGQDKTALEEAVRGALGQYTIHYDLAVE